MKFDNLVLNKVTQTESKGEISMRQDGVIKRVKFKPPLKINKPSRTDWEKGVQRGT